MKCRDCRFWSERLAQSLGGGPMEAYCLSDHGPYRGMYTTGTNGCEAAKAGPYGAIDTPGQEAELAALYKQYDESDHLEVMA